jgi:hypothetical protein
MRSGRVLLPACPAGLTGPAATRAQRAVLLPVTAGLGWPGSRVA